MEGGGGETACGDIFFLCVCLFLNPDIAELDGGQAATVTFPEVNDLTLFDVKVRAEWTGRFACGVCFEWESNAANWMLCVCRSLWTLDSGKERRTTLVSRSHRYVHLRSIAEREQRASRTDFRSFCCVDVPARTSKSALPHESKFALRSEEQICSERVLLDARFLFCFVCVCCRFIIQILISMATCA